MKRRYDQYHFSVREWCIFIPQIIGLSFFLNYLFYRSIWGLILLFPVGWLYLREQKKYRLKKLRQQLHYHFKDSVSALHTALRTGYSLENAVKETYLDLLHTYGKKDPMVRELFIMCNQIKLKVPVEELFLDLGVRSHIEDIRTFAEVIQIAKRTGGNLDQILQSIWRTLSDKIETHQEIDAGIASKKYEQTIISCMPAGIILYLQICFPSLLSEMYTTSAGRIIMTVCLIVYAAAYLLGGKIVEIEI